MKTTFGSRVIELNPSGENYVAVYDGKKYRVEILRVHPASGRIDLRLTALDPSVSLRDSATESVDESVYVSSDKTKRWVTARGQTLTLTKTSGAKQGVRHDHAGGLIAPMPGQIRSVAVGAGDAVKKGQTLLTMEAMKMEIRIQALKDGVVKSVSAAPGQAVEREQILIEMED
ncbi:MAG: biotin/lipoyl-binding protein [Anaerolineales bacterium]|nr:biotin/lipoyl-binding protein [Anaerolineales bacterium]